MGEQLAASPLAQELGKTELTFADVRRRDLPPRDELPGISDEKYERAKYRLHVIGSDITTGRMIILPDDLPDYTDKDGRPFDKDSFPLVEAVRPKLFGGWEGNWVAFNTAHDVALPNATQGGKLGFFMYPQSETAQGRRDSLDPDNLKYAITTREIKA